MSLVINLILLITFVVISIKIFGPSFDKYRCFVLPDMPTYSYRMSKNMYFIVFIVCTAPFFLGQLSLLKYGVYFLIMIWLLLKKRMTIKIELISTSYLLFYSWLIISCFYANINYDTFSLLIKYLLPILSLWMGYSAIDNKYDLYHFSKVVAKACAVYALLAGGIGGLLLPWLYSFFLKTGMILVYAGLADYFTSLFIVPFIYVWISGQKKYLYVALMMLASTILESVRTGLGGILLVVCFYAFFRHKLKSVPAIVITGLLFVGVILFVPEVNEKFFGDKAGSVAAEDVITGNALSLDNIQTSGRSVLWDVALTNFYDPNPIFGSGLGEATNFMKKRAVEEHTIALLHNDYVQILCDNGLVGLCLLIIFYICIICKVFRYTWLYRGNVWVRITGVMAISSMAGVAFSMGFDNVVSHSMTSLINPFIFIGFFLKFVDLYKYDRLS